MGPCVVWDHALYGTMRCMGPCVVWDHALYGTMRCMGPCVVWDRELYGTMRCMGPCVVWDHALYGTMRCMGPCVVWDHALYGTMRYMGPCVVWDHALYGTMRCMGPTTDCLRLALPTIDSRLHDAHFVGTWGTHHPLMRDVDMWFGESLSAGSVSHAQRCRIVRSIRAMHGDAGLCSVDSHRYFACTHHPPDA